MIATRMELAAKAYANAVRAGEVMIALFGTRRSSLVRLRPVI